MTVTVQVERFYGHEEVGEFETNNTNPEDIAEDLCDYLLELYPNTGFNIINVNAGDGYIDVKMECMGRFMAQEYFYLTF
jgi:hypothetical protein